MSSKHGWNTWENYLRVHEKVLKNCGNIITQNPRYKIQKITENYYILRIDRLELQTIRGSKILIKINKEVYVKEGARRKIAKTYKYSYHAQKKSLPTNLIRYCSPHESHNKFHHRHDYTTGLMKTELVEQDDVPHVSEFLDELIYNF